MVMEEVRGSSLLGSTRDSPINFPIFLFVILLGRPEVYVWRAAFHSGG